MTCRSNHQTRSYSGCLAASAALRRYSPPGRFRHPVTRSEVVRRIGIEDSGEHRDQSVEVGVGARGAARAVQLMLIGLVPVNAGAAFRKEEIEELPCRTAIAFTEQNGRQCRTRSRDYFINATTALTSSRRPLGTCPVHRLSPLPRCPSRTRSEMFGRMMPASASDLPVTSRPLFAPRVQ